MKYLLLTIEGILLIAIILVIFGIITNKYLIGFVYLLAGVSTLIISLWKRKQINSK